MTYRLQSSEFILRSSDFSRRVPDFILQNSDFGILKSSKISDMLVKNVCTFFILWVYSTLVKSPLKGSRVGTVDVGRGRRMAEGEKEWRRMSVLE